MLAFEWDGRKNRRNRTRHGIWFEEAKTAFEDPRAILVADPDHSEHEERISTFGNEFFRQSTGRRSLFKGS
jgi:uncharacterized protein